jgi:peptidyl-prolyl cis-trans isomerase C
LISRNELRIGFQVKLLREPLLHFFLIGAAIYGAYAIYGAPAEEGGADERRIVVDKAQVDGFVAAWQARWSRPPTEQELDGLIQRFIRESIYYREAVAMGLDQDDPITRRRMAQKLEFLTKDIAAMKEPADGELERFFEDNRDDYKAPDLISFTHVFIDPDKRGDATLDDASALLAELTAIGPPDATTADKGDRFLLRSEFVQQSELEVRKSLGSGFAASVRLRHPPCLCLGIGACTRSFVGGSQRRGPAGLAGASAGNHRRAILRGTQESV